MTSAEKIIPLNTKAHNDSGKSRKDFLSILEPRQPSPYQAFIDSGDVVRIGDAVTLSALEEPDFYRHVREKTIFQLKDNYIEYYPKWQFEPEVWTSLPYYISLMPELSPWEQYKFFVTPNPQIDDLTPLQAMRCGLYLEVYTCIVEKK